MLNAFFFKAVDYRLGKAVAIIGLLLLLYAKVFKVFVSKDNFKKFIAD